MAKHTHNFVEQYDGPVAFGLDRQADECTLTYYLQKFSDDRLMSLIRTRMSDSDIQALSDLVMRLMKNHLTDEEYHEYFLKDEAD